MSVEILQDKYHKTYETPSDNAHRFTASSVTRNGMQVSYLINLLLLGLGGAGLKNRIWQAETIWKKPFCEIKLSKVLLFFNKQLPVQFPKNEKKQR